MKPDSVDSAGTVFRTKHPGSGAVAIHDEGRVCAVGCWDGRYVFIDGCRINQKKYNNKQKRSSLYSVRLFSTRSFKPLGTLVHHKAGVQTLAFAHARLPPVTGRRCRRHRHHHCHDHDQHERHERHLETNIQRHPNATNSGEAAEEAGGSDSEGRVDFGVSDEGHGGEAGDDEIENDDEDDEMTTAEKERRARWLVSGAKDGRVLVWELMHFSGARSRDPGT